MVPLVLAACSTKPIGDVLADCGPAQERQDPGGDLHRVTLDAGSAVCNDGSPATMYVRAATAPEDEGAFVVYLNGGRSCATEQTCTERWCTSRTLMSSTLSAPTEVGVGILDADPEVNPFASWNAVSVSYCTSDTWLGTARDVELDGEERYTLSFRGHHVVEAVLDTLDRGAVSDDGVVGLPPLAEGARLVWSGSSAGAVGALQHLDAVAARSAGLAVTGVFDSPLFPAPGTLPADVEARIEDALRESYETSVGGVWRGVLDESCLTAGAAWRCANVWTVESEHLEHPYLVRHDLYDRVGAEQFVEEGATLDEYAAAGEATARQLAALRPDVGVLGPACGDHIVLTEPAFSRSSVADALAPAERWSLAAAASAFASTGERMVAVDTPERRESVCSKR